MPWEGLLVLDFTCRQISVGALFSAACWLLGLTFITLVCAGVIVRPGFAAAGLAVILAGALRTVCASVRSAADRDRDLFQMGRDSVTLMRR